jgi:hypothetical protein
MKKILLLLFLAQAAFGQTTYFLSNTAASTITFDTNKSATVDNGSTITLNGSGNVVGVVVTATINGFAKFTSDFKLIDGRIASGTNYATMTYFGANDVRVRIYQTIDGPTYFDPSKNTNLVLWLDGADASTVTNSSTLTWADKSSFSNNATQSSATAKATYSAGNKGFTFSSSNPGSSFNLTNNITLNRKAQTTFFVFNQADQGNHFFFSSQSGGAATYMRQRTISSLTDFRSRTITNIGTFDGNIVIGIKCTSAGVYTYLNGVPDNSISANSTGSDIWNQIGTFDNTTTAQTRGLVESLVVHDVDLTDAQILTESKYLKNRFISSTAFTFDNYIQNSRYIKVYFLAGQSNAQGHGNPALLPSGLQAPLQGAKIYDYNYNKISDIVAGTNTLTISNDFGFEVTFTNSMVKYKGENILIIKYAVGSSYLGFTGSSDWNVATVGAGSHLQAFKDNVTNAYKVLQSQGLTPVPSGFLWMQGEQDATNLTYANAYLVNERALRDNLRTFLNAPNLPWVSYTIRGQSADAPEIYYATVNAAKTTLSSDANCYLINTSTYTILAADSPHWDEAGLQQGGTDGFNVLKNLN